MLIETDNHNLRKMLRILRKMGSKTPNPKFNILQKRASCSLL